MNKFIFIIMISFLAFSQEEYIAIMTLDGMGIRDQEATILTERLTSKMIEIKKYIVIERANVDKIMKEQKFQYSGCTDTQCAVEIGKMLNSNYILIGNASKLGQTYSMDCRIIDVQTSEAVKSASYTTKGSIDELFYGADNIAMQLCDIEVSAYTEIKSNEDTSSNQIEEEPKKNNRSGYYISADLGASYLYTIYGESEDDVTDVSGTYDSGALTIGYEYALGASQKLEFGISYDIIGLGYEYRLNEPYSVNDPYSGKAMIDGDQFLNLYYKYNFMLDNPGFNNLSWWWISMGWSLPSGDLVNLDMWDKEWEGGPLFGLGYESESGWGSAILFNYVSLDTYYMGIYLDPNFGPRNIYGTLDNMVSRFSVYYSF